MLKNDFVLDQISPRDRVLNVGCCGDDWEFESYWGGGNALHKLLEDRVGRQNLVGVDINGPRLAEMRDNGYAVHEVSAEALNRLDEGGAGKFDAVVAGDVIEHLTSPGLFLDTARQSVKPGGKLVLTTTHIHGFWYWFLYGVLKRPEPWPEHACYFSPSTLRQTLERHGWQIQTLAFTDYCVKGRRFRLIKAIPEMIRQLRACLCIVATVQDEGAP